MFRVPPMRIATDVMPRLRALPGALAMAAVGAALVAGCAVIPEQTVRRLENPVFPPPPEQARFIYERTLYSSLDVIDESESSKFEQVVTGGMRVGEPLDKPYGIAVFKGRVYVGDTVRRSIAVFDIPARKFSRIGEEDPGSLRLPLGLDVDGDGNLYVADGTTKRIQVYDREGRYLRQLGGPEMFSRPVGIAVDGAATRIYVVDIGGVDSEQHRVRVFDPKSGKHLFDFGKRGEKDGEFNLPRDAAVAPDGRVYVVDGGNFRVQVFDRDGRFLKVFGVVGRQGGTFSRPKEIAIDGDGRVYFVDQFFRKVDVFRPAGLAPGAGYVAGSTPKSPPR